MKMQSLSSRRLGKACFCTIAPLFGLLVAAGASDAGAEVADAPAFSYDQYASVLEQYVDDQGMVNYAALKKNRAELDRFIVSMGALNRESYEHWDEQAQIAFWCNAYNAITLKRIIDHYPIQKGSWLNALRFPENSIRQISGVWDTLKTPVLGREMTLDAIEHEVLRKQFKEPRIHMALVCAAMGCPPLRNEPYVGKGLDEQLDEQSKQFLSNSEKFRIDRDDDVVYLSPILDWFGEDFKTGYTPKSGFDGFGETERAVLSFASRYVSEREKDYLEAGEYSIEYLDYDWSLNEQK